MRRKIRMDFAIALLVAVGAGALVNFGAGKVIDSQEKQSEELVYSNTEVGAAAGEEVPVVTSISEMMEEERFTFHVDNIGSSESVYYKGNMYYIYELESGETVLVDEYYQNTYYEDDESDTSLVPDMYAVLPVGKVVLEPLDDEMVQLIQEEGYALTDYSFYVDMKGKYRDFSEEDFENTTSVVSFLVGVLVFFFIRYVLIASGLFAPIIPLRFLKTWKKYIDYYGVIYYDENIEQILALRKQGRMEEAANEFSKLVNIDMEEAQMAMGVWDDIYGEGILHVK